MKVFSVQLIHVLSYMNQNVKDCTVLKAAV